MGWGLPLFEISQGIPILRYQKTSKMAVSFSFSAYFPNTEILETRINPRFFALVLGQGFIFVQPSQGFSQESCGSWDFSFSGKRLPFSRFMHNLRTIFKKTHNKRRETGPLGFRPAFLFCLFFPGTYAFFRSTASAMHSLAASSAWAIRWE